jgi:hypothetical protein
MNSALLRKIFPNNQWSAPCTIVLEANAAIQPLGQDSVSGGTKVYSPRAISGRLQADAACFAPDGFTVLVVQQQKVRMPTGGDVYKQTLTVVDADKIVAVEFFDAALLPVFGVMPPVIRSTGSSQGSDPGTITRPK